MAKPVLGIMTLYLNDDGLLEERSVYRRMTAAARKLGMELIVFTPEDVNFRTNRIHAMRWNPSGGWSREWSGFPHMIYDRCRIQKSRRFELLKRFRARYASQLYLNKPIGNKWSVYRTLARDARFRPHLPQTRLYEDSRDLNDMIKRYALLYLKPAGGTGGRGILRIQRGKDGSLLIQGRDRSRRIIRPSRVRKSGLLDKLSGWNLRDNRYLVQQGIQIKLGDGRVHDYRLLVQKNGKGEWSVTGCAARIGPKGSVTSNLHGGGRAASMAAVLPGWVGGAARAERVREETESFGLNVARYLEEQYGPLCELALDIAIDRGGHFWLLEVNPKPAREVFREAGELDAYRRALVRPLQYALWLYKNRPARRRSAGSGRSSRSRFDDGNGMRSSLSRPDESAGASRARVDEPMAKTSGFHDGTPGSDD